MQVSNWYLLCLRLNFFVEAKNMTHDGFPSWPFRIEAANGRGSGVELHEP